MYGDERTILYLYSSHQKWLPGELVVKPWEIGLVTPEIKKRVVRLSTRYIKMMIESCN